jgi:hypothetical protein
MTRKEYILWGTPKGEIDPIYAQVLSTQAQTPDAIESIKELAAADGWHSFSVQILDLDAVPDFVQILKQ